MFALDIIKITMKRRRTIMKLVVIADNNTYIDQYYLAEPALSIYI